MTLYKCLNGNGEDFAIISDWEPARIQQWLNTKGTGFEIISSSPLADELGFSKVLIVP
jgi:hypothetical protein